METCHGIATTASSKATTASQGMFTIDITGIGKTPFLPVNTSSGRRKRNEQNDLKKTKKNKKTKIQHFDDITKNATHNTNRFYFDDEIKEKKEEKNYVPTVKMPCGRILIGRPGEPYYETITRYGYYKDGLDESDLDLSCENEVQYLQTKKGVPEGIFVIDRKGENNMEEQLQTNVQEHTEYNSHTIDDNKWATHIEKQLTNSDTRIEYMPPEITRQPTTDQKIENLTYINTVKLTVKKEFKLNMMT